MAKPVHHQQSNRTAFQRKNDCPNFSVIVKPPANIRALLPFARSKRSIGHPRWWENKEKEGCATRQQNGGSPAPNLSFNSSTNQVTNGGFAYDAAGNMISDGTHSYSYDAEGNLIKVDGGSTATYTYDALNHRVRTQNTGQDNYEYIFNPSGQRVSIWDASYGGELEGNSYWGSAPVEFYDNGIAQFQQQDWLGTERLATDNSGSVEGTYTSLPFGDGLTTSGSDNDAYHFAGLDYDFSSGTYHAQFRQYYPTSGQWISPDLFAGSYDFSNPQSLNRYSYVLNNPLSIVDPAGLDGCGPTTMGCSGPPIAAPFCFIFCFGGGGPSPAHGSFHGFVGRPSASPWDEYHIHYGADIADALGLPDAGCEFGACGGGAMGLSGGDFTSTASIKLSPWMLQIYGFAHAANGLAPNGSGCSVLDPNCKRMGPVAKYATFLNCEWNITWADVTDASPASFGALAAGATGVKQMISFLNGVGKGVPVINEIAALYDVAMADLEAVKSNQACTAAVYGR